MREGTTHARDYTHKHTHAHAHADNTHTLKVNALDRAGGEGCKEELSLIVPKLAR